MTPEQLEVLTPLARKAAQIDDRQNHRRTFMVLLDPLGRGQIAALFASLARAALGSPEGEHHAD